MIQTGGITIPRIQGAWEERAICLELEKATGSSESLLESVAWDPLIQGCIRSRLGTQDKRRVFF